MTAFLSILSVALVGLAALVAVFLAGMRTKWPPVSDRVRYINRRFLNPQQMETAGEPGAYAQILRHTGRTSGQAYETPLAIVPTDDGFIIGLVYGERTQWLRNVLAAGQAEVVREGVVYRVDRPEVVPMAEATAFFSASDQRMSGLFGVDRCLRLYHVDHD